MQSRKAAPSSISESTRQALAPQKIDTLRLHGRRISTLIANDSKDTCDEHIRNATSLMHQLAEGSKNTNLKNSVARATHTAGSYQNQANKSRAYREKNRHYEIGSHHTWSSIKQITIKQWRQIEKHACIATCQCLSIRVMTLRTFPATKCSTSAYCYMENIHRTELFITSR